MTKIAIVGNIASGKSTVEEILRKQGYQVYDTDIIAHKILADSKIAKEKFPEAVINNEIDRKKLAEIVFSDKEKLNILESIIHPKIEEFILNINSEEPIFISVPQLFETGMEKLFDKIVFISAPIETRLERLMKRNNLTKEEALIRINAQLSEEEKISKSDFIIKNNGTKEDLELDILHLFDYKS